MQPVSCVLFEVSDGGGPGICSPCKGSGQQWATRPPRASLGLPCMAWGMGTAELPRPQLWASRQLPPLRKGLHAEGPWAALPRLSPGTRTGRPTLVSRVTAPTAPPSGASAGLTQARACFWVGVQPASDPACCPLPCIPGPRPQPQIPAVLKAGCSPRRYWLRNSPSHLACHGLSPWPVGSHKSRLLPGGGLEVVTQGRGGPGPHTPHPGGQWQPSLDVRQGVMSFLHTRLLKRDGPQVLGWTRTLICGAGECPPSGALLLQVFGPRGRGMPVASGMLSAGRGSRLHEAT